MSGTTSQVATLAAAMGVAAWMAVAGVAKSALEWKRPKRRCPSCGRQIDGRTCGHHL
jgi:NADH pyrophosphatase NudC (nudix superfamily)